MLFLWTDGLSDALMPPAKVMVSSAGAARIRLSTRERQDCFLAAIGAVTAFAAGTSQFDDLTALAIHLSSQRGGDPRSR